MKATWLEMCVEDIAAMADVQDQMIAGRVVEGDGNGLRFGSRVVLRQAVL